jgi:hypothetical protein
MVLIELKDGKYEVPFDGKVSVIDPKDHTNTIEQLLMMVVTLDPRVQELQNYR